MLGDSPPIVKELTPQFVAFDSSSAGVPAGCRVGVSPTHRKASFTFAGCPISRASFARESLP